MQKFIWFSYLFYGFNYIDFTIVAASNTATDDVKN